MPQLAYGEPDTTSPDPGLFGPASVTWRVHADPAVGVGGLRAILLQAMLPGPMIAAAASSDYRRDPWGRLARTAEYIGAITYGTTDEAERAAAMVRRLHARLGLDDPAWLLWVHAAFVDSLLDAYRRSGAPMTDAEADAYVHEQREAARLVGLDPAAVFGDAAGLRAYLGAIERDLLATEEALDFLRFAFVPPLPTTVRWLTPAAPGWAAIVSAAFALLPAPARGQLARGLAGEQIPLLGSPLGLTSRLIAASPLVSLQGTMALRSLRISLARLPAAVREGPHLRAARTRLALAEA